MQEDGAPRVSYKWNARMRIGMGKELEELWLCSAPCTLIMFGCS